MADVTIEIPPTGMSRREFLYYIWGASMALLLAQGAGLLLWFALPRFREGEFGGTFTVPVELLPEVNASPANFPDGRFWLVNLDTTNPQGQKRMYKAPDETGEIIGAAAIYKVCTHLGCIYAWVPTNNRFECPCHGSKYRLDGRRIEAPAPRSLDAFELAALDAGGNELARSSVGPDGDYLPLPLPPGTALLRVHTGAWRLGRTDTLLCNYEGNCP